MESDSDNEAPEVISTQAAKTVREVEIMDMFLQKRKIRDEQKLKRKLKADKFAAQKKEKQMRQKLLQHDQDEVEDLVDKLDDDNLDAESNLTTCNTNINPDEGQQIQTMDTFPEETTTKKNMASRKYYPKYNIAVDSLNKLSNPRATSALNFKEKRLAKAHREQVASTVLSYRDKMLVKNYKNV